MATREVLFLLFDGFAALDAVGPADVFLTANQQAGEAAYRLRYLAPGESVTASNAMRFVTEPLAAVPPETARGRMLLVPGADETPLLAAQADAVLGDWLAAAGCAAVRVCSVCSGAFLLGAAGLLEGRRATTHWRGLSALAHAGSGARIEHDALFVEDGKVWTSAGVTAGIDMALAIVARDLGQRIALAVAREMVLFLVRPGSQAQFSAPLDLQARAAQGDLAELAPWLEARLAGPVSVAAMAAAMGMSERTFHRRCRATYGATPLALLQRLRIDRARQLLEEGRLPLKQIAHHSGLGDAANLRRQFKAILGISPQTYAERFGIFADRAPATGLCADWHRCRAYCKSGAAASGRTSRSGCRC